MKYLIGTDDKPFYLWQMLVQINNFRKLGIEQDAYFVIVCHNNKPSPELLNIINDPDLKCHFEVYDDDRKAMRYSSTLRLRGIKYFWLNNEWFEKETFMYLDPDVVFTIPFDWSKHEKGDTWYVSDTKSYLDTKYVKSKSEKLFHEMCNIVGVTPEQVEAQDPHCGGAQYIMKNVPYEFWDKVEIDSENLFNHMKSTETIYHPQHPIQSWTADMWAVLWNALFFERKVEISPDMNFCWASDSMKRWEERVIFHDAGVVKEDGVRFCKVTHQRSPFNKELKVSDTSASFNYVKEIRETEKTFPHLLF